MHDDPSGKLRLRQAIQRVRDNEESEIRFVAMEYAHSTYQSLLSSRGRLEQQLRDEFGWLGEEFISRFARTLAYEGDLHQEEMPSTEPIWMLDGFERNDISIANRDLTGAGILVKMTNLSDWLLPRIPNARDLAEQERLRETTNVYLTESRRLASIVDAAAQMEELKRLDPVRESHMTQRVASRLSEKRDSDRLGMVIVGTVHLLDHPNSLYGRLKGAGFLAERRWPHEQVEP